MKSSSKSIFSLVLPAIFVFTGLAGKAEAQLASATLLSAAPGASASDFGPGKSLEQVVVDLINKQRAENSLPPLAWNPQVAEIARTHSKDMGWNNYFNHRGQDGRMVSDRAETSGIEWHMIGENIAMVGGFNDPIQHVVEGWMNSPGHRKNILDPRWRETGVGIYISSTGTYYFTQVFLTKQ